MRKNSDLKHILIILVIGTILYLNTFEVPFYLDDILSIKENPDIKDLSQFLASFGKTPFMHGTRFIGYLSFALNYKINGLDLVGYHIVNLLIHLISAVLVYIFITFLLQTPVLKQNKSGPDSKAALPFVISAIFLVHPVQTQAVTYIVQRLTSLATMFYLLSIVLYLVWRVKHKNAFSLLGSIVSAVLAMLTKEISFTLPGVIILIEFTFFSGNWKEKVKRVLPFLPIILVIPIILMAFKGGTTGNSLLPRADGEAFSRLEYFLTEMRVIITYIRLLIFPVNQSIFYDYPVYKNFFEPAVLLSTFTHLAFIVLAVLLIFKRRVFPYGALIGFGIIWFYITLSVESSLIPIRDIIFEHRLYLPSIGFITSVCTAGYLVLNKVTNKKIYQSIPAIVVILVLCIITYNRNNLWNNKLSMWRDVVEKAPKHTTALISLSSALIDNGLYDEAEKYLRKLLRIDPNYERAYYNLGYIYAKKKKPEEARQYFLKTIEINPAFYKAYNNLGSIYLSEGDYERAFESFKKALKINPYDPTIYYNLGNLFYKNNRLEKAKELYSRAIELNPEYASAYNNLGSVYFVMNKTDLAIENYKRAIILRPDYGIAYYNLYKAYQKLGDNKKAQEFLFIARKLLKRLPE